MRSWDQTMNARSIIGVGAVLFIISGSAALPSTKTGGLTPAAEKRVDKLVTAKLDDYELINVGLVKDGTLLLSKAYGQGVIDGEYQYGSVSKPLTSTILLILRQKGLIKSLDDNVWEYLPDLKNAMPDPYKGSPLTLRHLLTHTSGIPHNDEPPLIDQKFNLKFKPGTGNQYSTPAYGILGLVIEAVSGSSYSDAVHKLLGEPVGAPSLQAMSSFIAPGAFVESTIRDMALYAIGMMTGAYLPQEILTGEAWRPAARKYGLGWSVENVGGPELTVFHGGSNGLPRAYLLMKPVKKTGVVLFGTARSFDSDGMNSLAESLLAFLEGLPKTEILN
jgi:CubicO group peptidase (beta-lactamase class C family)